MAVTLDALFRDATKWREEAQQLRRVLRGCGLGEELKWGKACYTSAGKNVVIIQRQKAFLALLFFDGALLSDPRGVLHKTGPNTRVGRRMLFTSVSEVVDQKDTIEAYIREARDVQRAGLTMEEPAAPALPDEVLRRFDQDPGLKGAFYELTPGRQRHYAMYFSEPKQAKTRTSRIAKHAPRILEGKGLRDS